MIAVQLAERLEHRFAGAMFECARGIHKAAVEEDPAWLRARRFSVGERDFDRAPRKGCRIDPGERASADPEFVPDDAPAGLVDDIMVTPPKLSQQCRLSAPGTAR